MLQTFTSTNIVITYKGLAGIAKVILASEHELLPANLHYTTPNPDIPSLEDGRIQVVNETTQWSGGIIGVSSYGFGGANVHAILKTPDKDAKKASKEPIQLFVTSSRTEEGVHELLKLVKEHPHDVELHALLDSQINLSPKSHPARGYIRIHNGEKSESQVKHYLKFLINYID